MEGKEKERKKDTELQRAEESCTVEQMAVRQPEDGMQDCKLGDRNSRLD